MSTFSYVRITYQQAGSRTYLRATGHRYGHLFPGSEDEAAELADAYLARVRPHAVSTDPL